MHSKNYLYLLIMTAPMLVAMFWLMYATVGRLENVHPNLKQFYMAGLVTAPMVLIELAVMREMYENRTANISIAIISLLTLFVFWFGIRHQIGVADGQYLKSMIPHHAGATLMCEKASIENTQIQELCRKIIADQQSEISQMKALLARLK